jgi:two-component system, NarL family, nitrate/nitrite response regulator NarL
LANTQSIGVLIVDDQAEVRRALRHLLRMFPDCFLAGEANDGQEALNLATQIKPDIVLMDVNMPVMDGFEATKQLREMLPDTKVLILTQHNSPQAVDAAKGAGAYGFLVKSDSRNLSSAIAAVSKGLPYFPV